MALVHLNGALVPAESATVSVHDRGFLFADGIYEVTPVYGGRPFRLERHLARLRRGLCELRIDWDADGFGALHHELLEANGLSTAPMSVVYLQVTRGAAPRNHAFPAKGTPATVYAFARAFERPSEERWERGFSAITFPDQRWSRCDLKTVGLLPSVLAQQGAIEAGADDALLVRDGLALEGAHSNLFVVFGDRVVTHPASNQILHGITREAVLEVARAEGLEVEERPTPLRDVVHSATELFFTGTTTEVRPTVQLDGRPIGEGRVGPVVRRIRAAFERLIERETRGAQEGGA